MKSLKINHPGSNSYYFIFREDETYAMFDGEREITQPTSEWRLQDNDGMPWLLCRAAGSNEWKNFWDDVRDGDIKCFASKLLSWQVHIALMGDEHYAVDENT
jgi:hypothetical protein